MDEFTQDNIDQDYIDDLRRRGAPLIADRLERANKDEPYCGVYWIITTCWIAIAAGAALGVLLWLVLA